MYSVHFVRIKNIATLTEYNTGPEVASVAASAKCFRLMARI